MNRLSRPTSLAWLALVAVAAACILLAAARRISQIERVSQLAPAARTDDSSPTGYARGTRSLLLPVGSTTGQPWVMDVQKMLAAGSWQATRAGYDNAPDGRAVQGASPYRWWLRLIASLGSGQPGRNVERAALHADSILHGLLGVGLGLFAAWRFGGATGGLLALGIAGLFPLASAFRPGQPDEQSLFLGAHLAGLILLLAGSAAGGRTAGRLCFAGAGAAGGLGLWIDAGTQLPALGALGLGGVLAVFFTARPEPGTPAPVAPPWRWWAAGIAAVSLVGWLTEGRPGGVTGLTPEVNHPLLFLAALGGAETLVRLHAWRQGGGQRSTLAGLAAAVVILLAPMVWLLQRSGGKFSFGPAGHLLGPGTGGEGLAGWIGAEGLSLGLVAALLPVLLVAGAIWRLRSAAPLRPTLALAFGPALALLGLSVFEVRWWGLLDTALLGLLVALPAVWPKTPGPGWWRAGVVALLLPGFMLAWPKKQTGDELTPAEARGLIERDLAQWLAARSVPGAIVLAPPALSASLCYYGGLPVIASPYVGNDDGLAYAVRVSAAASTDEAQALVQRRGIQYLILPSWDNILDEFAKLGAPAAERPLIALLRQWQPPRWLRPVPYQLPLIEGLEGDAVFIFEVVEPQENAAALSRLAEYFVEMQQPGLAAAVSETLARSFAGDPGALIARAQVALSRADAPALAAVMAVLLPAIAEGRDEDLTWERRAHLALILAQVKRVEQARAQVRFCLAEAGEEQLRSLGTASLYRLLVLSRAYGIGFTDQSLHALALDLLPAELRARLQP